MNTLLRPRLLLLLAALVPVILMLQPVPVANINRLGSRSRIGR